MEDCVAKNVARDRINEATRLYVISKMRLANEGKTGIFPAGDWVAEDKPILDQDETLYGISDLYIEKNHETETQARYTVSYLKYAPITPTQEVSQGYVDEMPLSVAVWDMREILDLRNMGKYWEIYRIIPEKNEELPAINPLRRQ
jgi:hypothetical protein